MSSKWIVITTINKPTEAIIKYAQMENWEVVVVGDTKTPKDWGNNNLRVHFLSIEDQKKLSYRIVKYLPEKCYMRKNIGYLYAIEHGAETIVDTDDDNIPTLSWENQWNLDNKSKYEISTDRWVNTYSIFGAKKSWPRGIPLTTISNQQPSKLKTESTSKYQVGIIQGLADGDPDVDAIYRLIDNTPITFKKRQHHLLLAKNSWTPINSQNTYFTHEFFPLLYLPSTVTFRSTDIIRGYVAQPILWEKGKHLAIANAGVVQIRNQHNYLDDFESEVPIYLNAEKIASITSSSVNNQISIIQNLKHIYQELASSGIVEDNKLIRIDAWIEDILDLLR